MSQLNDRQDLTQAQKQALKSTAISGVGTIADAARIKAIIKPKIPADIVSPVLTKMPSIKRLTNSSERYISKNSEDLKISYQNLPNDLTSLLKLTSMEQAIFND